MPPQPLQIVITSRAVKKNVADQVAIILKNPLPVVIPFQADGEFASVLHLGIDLVANGLILAGVRAGTNQEIIGETGNFSKIENYQVQGFLGLSRVGCRYPGWLYCVGAFRFQGRVWGLLNFADSVTSCPYRTTIIKVRLFIFLAFASLLVAQGVDMTELKRMEVERLRVMAEAGSIPRARLEAAQAELADAQDNSILRQTLYGSNRVEDFTKEQSDLMVTAAQRLVDRQQERYESTKNLVAEGIVPGPHSWRCSKIWSFAVKLWIWRNSGPIWSRTCGAGARGRRS